jgi:glutathione S-transferase
VNAAARRVRQPLLELWQTEWCPASRRVRQRLTELGLDVVLHQVPVDPSERSALETATGSTTIPVLAVGGTIVVGEDEIIDYLDAHFAEPPEASAQREKAAKARRKDLEAACPPLEPATR